jgi:hypothetical protein
MTDEASIEGCPGATAEKASIKQIQIEMDILGKER